MADLGTGFLVTNSTLEGLTELNGSPDGRALPRLAERWTWENNGLRLRLRLRQGVLFHDGTPFTAAIAAEALQATIDRPDSRALYPSLNDVTHVGAEGQSDLLIDLSQPSAFLPEELDFPITRGPGNIGTGPFRLVSREGTAAVLERFDRYYLGAPEIERITIRPFDTLRIAWASLLRGDVDVVTDVPPDALDFIRTDAIQVIPFTRRYQFLIAFNSRLYPFTSPAIRRALNNAVDREAIIDRVLQGQGQAATGPLWPQHWAYDNSMPAYGFDRELAASLLDNSGLREGGAAATEDRPPARFRFTCLLPADFSLLERIALEVQKQLFDVGVDMRFEVVSLADYNVRIREGRFEAVLIDLISGPTFGRPFIFWRSTRGFQGLNVFGYENPATERLFETLRTAMTEATVRSAAPRLQRALLDDPPALFLAWNARARAVGTHLNVSPETGRDPLLTIRLWTENVDSPAASTQ